MVGVLAIGAVYKAVGLLTIAAVVVIAGVAELLEFVFVKRLNERYGGSRKAFWGAIIGGIIGVFVGLPVPILGSVVAAFVGSFIGSAVVTLAETRDLRAAHRVGWGVVLGRALAAVVKVFAGAIRTRSPTPPAKRRIVWLVSDGAHTRETTSRGRGRVPVRPGCGPPRCRG